MDSRRDVAGILFESVVKRSRQEVCFDLCELNNSEGGWKVYEQMNPEVMMRFELRGRKSRGYSSAGK